jgi:hypothetical protein
MTQEVCPVESSPVLGNVLPGGAQLAPGEVSLVGDRFMFSTIAFFLHTDLVLTNRRLYAMRPNTVLGLIPVGTGRNNFPIENIAGVAAATRFSIAAVVFGGLAILVGLAGLSARGGAAFGVVLILLGLLSLVDALKQAVEVTNSGGGKISFPVSVFERSRTVEFANRVSEALARTPAGRQSEPSMASGPPTADPSEALRNLTRLRDDGLITEAEYQEKRSTILSRL